MNPHLRTGDSGVLRMSTATNTSATAVCTNHSSITPSSTELIKSSSRPRDHRRFRGKLAGLDIGLLKKEGSANRKAARFAPQSAADNCQRECALIGFRACRRHSTPEEGACMHAAAEARRMRRPLNCKGVPMYSGVGHGRLAVLALMAFILPLALLEGAAAAPHAAELGPVVVQAEVRGGFVGRLKVAPEHGPVGTPVTVTGEGLPPEQSFDLAWSTVTGSWKVTTAEYFGRAFTPVAYRIATVRSDASGRFTATFAAPDDFGFLHDIMLQQGDRLLTQNAFNVDMTVKLLSDRGPPGAPIEIEVHGYGYRELEDSWVLLYDNRYTGWMSAVTTAGSARVTIPATGGPGRHVLEVIHSDFTFPYRNK